MVAITLDPISNAVLSPEGSFFVRQILQSALANPATAAASWGLEAQAVLANILMNDVLNWWNDAGQNEVTAAQNAVNQAGDSALAHHARGLIYRFHRQHKLAMQEFRTAKKIDPGFARVHAQFGNQKILLGRESEAHAPLDKARLLCPHHPACGYFHWAEGRAYFQEQLWSNAIYWLELSVKELPTVWYNRCYLACAYAAAGDAAAARQAKQEFVNQFGQPILTRAINSLQPNVSDPATFAAARKRVLDFLSQP
jgi:tetratricopeptide (TPR) repeat protein